MNAALAELKLDRLPRLGKMPAATMTGVKCDGQG